MVRFMKWLESAVGVEPVTERSAAQRLEAFRREQEMYRGPSFEAISAYGAHGAIVHYKPTEESDLPLEPKGLYLIDSGGHYLDGTTDITRTVALSSPTDEQRELFTRVLKGHIALARATFPSGTKGSQLDTLARLSLWEVGKNYGHGTGHGVGSYLCVHEGPQRIDPVFGDTPLEEGMFLSIEPGYYERGKFGIRTENLAIVRRDEKKSSEPESFLHFETVTLCPIDLTLVDTNLLTPAEIEFLNNYHRRVIDTLSPHLTDQERQWLANKCREL
jgi:Xaa-Pro aminopeptidase